MKLKALREHVEKWAKGGPATGLSLPFESIAELVADIDREVCGEPSAPPGIYDLAMKLETRIEKLEEAVPAAERLEKVYDLCMRLTTRIGVLERASGRPALAAAGQ